MRLNLFAKSKAGLGYTPDWLKFTFKEDGKNMELTLDIQGEISYSKENLECCCKGELIPWTLYCSETGTEEDLYELSEEVAAERYPAEKLANLLRRGTDFEVGVYPVDDSKEMLKKAENDTFEKGNGQCELWVGDELKTITFEFDAENNV